MLDRDDLTVNGQIGKQVRRYISARRRIPPPLPPQFFSFKSDGREGVHRISAMAHLSVSCCFHAAFNGREVATSTTNRSGSEEFRKQTDYISIVFIHTESARAGAPVRHSVSTSSLVGGRKTARRCKDDRRGSQKQ